MRHPFTARRDQSLLLVIDVQEAMAKAIPAWQDVTRRIGQLIRAAELLRIPILFTEHYKKGLGETVPEIRELLQSEPPFFQKEHFSACLEPDFLDLVRSFDRPQLVVAGMETHVCVLQTGLDLIQAGYRLHLPANALASRFEEDRKAALDLFRQAGAVIGTAEIVIFQWLCRSNTPDFRAVLPIVK